MVEPRYVSTSDSSSHVMVSAVLAINAILTDTKKEGVVFWTRSQAQTEGVVFWTRYQMQCVGLGETRSTTIGLLLHAQEHFQY